MKGFCEPFEGNDGGFFLLPRETKSNNEKVWVNLSSTKGVFFVKDWNDPVPDIDSYKDFQSPVEIDEDGQTRQSADTLNPGDYTVLVVDDEPNIARLVEVNLEEAGYQVKTAVNGANALEVLEQGGVDMVVCDIMMPVMDGYELLNKLRADDRYKGLPFVALTAKTQYQDIFEGWQKGVDSYITKPFQPEQLLGEIEGILKFQREQT
jgi:CheY-like chemotaxis protein